MRGCSKADYTFLKKELDLLVRELEANRTEDSAIQKNTEPFTFRILEH